MALTLARSTLHEERLIGMDVFTLAAGDKLQVRKQVAGEITDVLPAQTVPGGKQWTVTVYIKCLESDA